MRNYNKKPIDIFNIIFTYTVSPETIMQLMRYFVVGGIAFVVDFIILCVFTSLFEVHYLISAVLGFVGGLTTNYILSLKWVFDKSQHSGLKSFLIFSLIGIVGLVFNEIIMFSFTDLLNAWYIWSKLIATVVVFIWNFTARKAFVF